MRATRDALLVLEDGTVFRGDAFGAEGDAFGEAVFNTSMCGYQEVLTDPSYRRQIVAMTSPHQGNYGVNADDVESPGVQVAGFVVREASRRTSSWRAQGSLDDYLRVAGVIGLEGVDTRRLTLHLRERGAMRAGLSTLDLDPASMCERVRGVPGMQGADLASEVSTGRTYEASAVVGPALPAEGRTYRVAALDFGIKRNILRLLARNGCEATILPAATSAADVLAGGFDGVFLSNGPGDPAATTYGITTVRELLGSIPVFGICLGHQLLGLALGGASYKLRFGHRGVNQPVKDLDTGHVEITSHNHGFAIDAGSFPDGNGARSGGEGSLGAGSGGGGRAERGPTSAGPSVTPVVHTEFGSVALNRWNLNDGTLEGLRCLDVPAFSVQYHPEAAPGPHDSRGLFESFRALMEDA